MAEKYITHCGDCYYGTMHSGGHPVPEKAFDILRDKCRELGLGVVDLFDYGKVGGIETVSVLCTDKNTGDRVVPRFRVRTYRVKGKPLPLMEVKECLSNIISRQHNNDEATDTTDAPTSVSEDDCRWWIERYYQDVAELATHPSEDRTFVIPPEMLVGANLDAVKKHLDNSAYYGGTWIQEDGSICVLLRQAELTDDDIDAFVEQEERWRNGEDPFADCEY